VEKWKTFIKKLDEINDLAQARMIAKNEYERLGIYPDSINRFEDSWIFMAQYEFEKALIIYGNNSEYDNFCGEEKVIDIRKTKICKLNNKNCAVIRKIFRFTNPLNHKSKGFTMGLGDRLGLASAGHIRLIKGREIFPVLAQQSIRELTLTGRNYEDVLCDASWAVFQEGYTEGFGADGDHLKTKDEVKMALENGYTMITLDCSEHIGKNVDSMTESEVNEAHMNISIIRRQSLEAKYLGKRFALNNGLAVDFDSSSLKRTILIYLKAIDFAIDVYNNIIKNCGRDIDFEMSVDETQTATLPYAHFFVASELFEAGVTPLSIAPKFHGEFQKGIDYKGDIMRFTEEFSVHVAISDYFGYKLSIHSGSDKFSIFPIIAEKTQGKVHIKTAGTNWLEALKVIAEVNPLLFKEIYLYAVKSLKEAKKYYHVSVDENTAPSLGDLNDEQLKVLLDMEESRQILHITYGTILQALDENKRPLFREAIYSLLNANETNYYDKLGMHIGRHIEPFEKIIHK